MPQAELMITKYLDLTIGKKIQTIKDLLLKAEKIIYISS